jgi:DNA helicase-2/ATP-dependent DNA helicase PcrA
MPWDSGLEGIHREVAANHGARLHVLAGPGTGKTFAMMRRVARLLEAGVAPERLLAVSFTRTAARDLREQLGALGVEGSENVRATTLHSLCFSVLGKQEVFALTNRAPRPLLAFERDCLEADLATPFGGLRNTRKLLAGYEAAWARLQHEDPGHTKSPEDLAFETALLSWLRFYASMLIGELVPLTLSFLNANPALNAAPEFDHVLVDEYQDLNKADQSLVRLLAQSGSLLVIGDDNQSIYSFRYANPEGIRLFPQDVAGTTTFTISECRRCPENVVAISNALIGHDPHTTRPVPLTPAPQNPKPPADVWIVQHDTLEDEVAATASFIHNYLEKHPETLPGRVLVLSTRRFIGNAIKDALISKGRNALSYFQEDELSAAAAAEGFCLLSLLVNGNDRASIRAWLGFGSGDHRRKAFARVRKHCEDSGISLKEALEALAAGQLSLPHTGGLIQRWNDLKGRLAALDGLSGLDLVNALWPVDAEDSADIRLIAARIAVDTPEPEALLDELRAAITQPELPGSDGDVIQVMSLHKSKGLTRDVVIVSGCMAGTLPSVRPDDPPEIRNSKIEEQRRLFYVALTRATRVLVISGSVLLPLGDALRGGATVKKKTLVQGKAHAIVAFTPFVAELGGTAPKALRTGEWKKAAGFE